MKDRLKQFRGKLAELFGGSGYWSGDGVLGRFHGHELDILVSADTPEINEATFGKTWFTDADEVIFRNGKQIKLYWRKRDAP